LLNSDLKALNIQCVVFAYYKICLFIAVNKRTLQQIVKSVFQRHKINDPVVAVSVDV